MIGRRKQAEAHDFAPRLYLIVEDEEPAHLPPSLEAALGSAPVHAVLIRGGSAGIEAYSRRLEAAAPVVQRRGIALLCEDHPDLVAELGADGSHVSAPDGLAPALRSLKPGFIVGAGGLCTRHDAMVAGEAGADYVMFGEPDGGGQRPATAAVMERVAWWAELFELPCVAYAPDMASAEALARAGADFVAVGSCVWNDPRGAAPAISEVWARLKELEFAS